MEFQSKSTPSEPSYSNVSGPVNPSGVRYSQIKPLGREAELRVMQMYPDNGSSFTSTNNNVITIPLNSPYGFLSPADTTLTLKITSSLGIAAMLDGDINCIFNRIRLIGTTGNPIEDQQHYNKKHHLDADYSYGLSQRIGQKSVREGRGSKMSFAMANPIYHTSYGTLSTSDTYGGWNLFFYGSPAYNKIYNLYYTYSTTLNLGLFKSDRYIPLGWIKGLRLEITLEQANSAFVSIDVDESTSFGSGYYTVSNIYLTAPTITFGGNFNSEFSQMLVDNNGISIPITTYFTSVNSISNGATSASVPISISCHSLKSIIFCMYETANAALATKRSISKRLYNATTQYQFRIGNRPYPTKAVQLGYFNPSEAMSEILKCYGCVNDLNNAPYAINREAYCYADVSPADAVESTGKFAIGLDLETFNEDSAILRSGLDVSHGEQIILDWVGTAVATTTIAFCIVDAVIYISPTGEITSTY